MPAIMRIDQAGLPAGSAGFARTDGLDTGALVTLTSVGGGSTHTFLLHWVPPGDTTAVPSLVQTGPTTWTFSPIAGSGSWGSYRIELVTDEGLSTESRQIRCFTIRTGTQLLIIPAANEVADPTVTLENVSAAFVDRSEQNEDFGPFVTGSAWGWWRAFSDLALAVEALAGGPETVRLAFNEEADGAVVGLAEVSIGMIRLTLGQTFDALAMVGTQGGADSAVLRLRRFTGGAQVASWTQAGLLASTPISSPLVVAATDWYEFTLATTGVGSVALCKGVAGTVV